MQIGIFYKYLYDIIIYPIFIHLSIYPYIIYLYPSFHPFIYWIIINTFLPTTSRCTATARKNLSIYPTIHLSFNLFKQIHFVYQSSIYFSKECFMRHPVLSFFSCMLFVCPLSQLACWGLMLLKELVYLLVLQRRLDSS